MKPLRQNALAPWAALIAAAVGTTVHQQLLSDMLHYECRLGRPSIGVMVGLAVLALMAVGCWISWASTRGAGEDEPVQANRRFIVRLSLLFAALLSIAVAWQTLATFLVPACPD